MRSLFGLTRDFERAVDQLFQGNYDRESGDLGAWHPAVDIRQTKEGVELIADLPGMDENDVEVLSEGNRLTLKGERKQQTEATEDEWYRCERTHGKFQRSFVLPRDIEMGKAKATFKNGVLTVSVPMKEEAKPQRLQIKAG
jgi:HSP20 family protein